MATKSVLVCEGGDEGIVFDTDTRLLQLASEIEYLSRPPLRLMEFSETRRGVL